MTDVTASPGNSPLVANPAVNVVTSTNALNTLVIVVSWNPSRLEAARLYLGRGRRLAPVKIDDN